MDRRTIITLVLVVLGISEISSISVDDNEASAELVTELSNRGKVVRVTFTCPAIYGRYPVPENCEYFFMCIFGYPKLMHCNRGYLYDPEKEQCRDKKKVKCQREKEEEPPVEKDKEIEEKEDTKYFKCPYIWGTFAHPYDCSQYFVCLYNIPKLFQCNNGLLYHDKIRRCLPRKKVECNKRLDRKGEEYECPYQNGRFPDPKDCSRYYECRSFAHHAYQCPQYQLYDEKKQHCMPARIVNCGKRPNEQDAGGNEFRCPHPFGRYADPQNCSKYYECRKSVAYPFHCFKNQMYDEKQRHCKPEQYVKCGKRPRGNDDAGDNNDSRFQCPSPSPGRYPDPQDCSRYYECRSYFPYPYKCPQNQLYDETKKHCMAAKTVNCGKRPGGDSGSNKFQCPSPEGRYPDPQDCSRYYECRSSIPYPYQCPKSQLYDARDSVKHCMAEQTVNCGQRPGGNDEGNNKFYCPFPFGRFSDPEDCSRYYECRFSVPYLYQCLNSQLYDERKEHCNEAKYVKCGRRPSGNDADKEPKDDNKEGFRCPYIWGTFSHPVDCSKYIVCVYNVPTVYSCRKNALFHALYRRCLPKEKVSCDDRVNPDEILRPVKTTVTPTITTTTTRVPTTTTTTRIPTTTTTTRIPTTTTTTRIPTTTTTTRIPTTTTTTRIPTTTTTTPVPTTTTPTRVPTTTTTTPVPTTSTTTRVPTTTTTTRVPTTTTTTTRVPTTTTTTTRVPITSPQPVTKPNTPPPTDCEEDDLDCIIDGTGDVSGWFGCPKRFGHFPHGSSQQLFIHCDNFRPYVKKCADKTVFSPVYLVCVWVNKKDGMQ